MPGVPLFSPPPVVLVKKNFEKLKNIKLPISPPNKKKKLDWF